MQGTSIKLLMVPTLFYEPLRLSTLWGRIRRNILTKGCSKLSMDDMYAPAWVGVLRIEYFSFYLTISYLCITVFSNYGLFFCISIPIMYSCAFLCVCLCVCVPEGKQSMELINLILPHKNNVHKKLKRNNNISITWTQQI